MSYITDIMLHLGTNEYDTAAVAKVNTYKWHRGTGTEYSLADSPLTVVDIGRHYKSPEVGGYKVFTHRFMAGSYNYLDLAGLVEHLRGIPWRYPKQWVLVADVEGLDSMSLFWQDGERYGELVL